MKRTSIAAATAALVIAALALAGCASGTQAPTPSSGAAPGAATPGAEGVKIEIREFAFGPAEAQAAIGQTVEWTNKDTVAHTVTGDGWDSGQLSQGQSYKRVFDKAGTYAYACAVHPAMKGSVIVK